MKSRTLDWFRFGLMLALICVLTTPLPAAAGIVPPIPTGPLNAQGLPATPDYYTTANWANSPPLAKFVDTLPGLGSLKANNLGQYLSVAKPDVTSYPGSDYYEIELVEFKERLHSDLPLPGTLLRGYVQVNRGSNLSPGTLPSQNKCGADQHACTAADTAAGTGINPDPVRYLGPSIVSERDRPVRIKFTNKLPVGTAGNLFIPVDSTVMGAGSGPAYPGATRGAGANCDNTVEPNTCASYTQNRADLHLHGGRTPWISDGTPHQWITPAGEITPFTKGVSLQNVPDMPDPGDGSSTYYYTNQQSARLMFYHDHAFGITRLNVYAGEAAGYLITDQFEQDLVTRGIIPPDQIPLIIQDKTFVDATPTPHPVSGVMTPKIRITDPLWNWGSGPLLNGVRTPVTGDLWLPHVYMPAQTLAAGFGGVNPFGRWMYGPWFYPATAVEKGPVANPYYDADCSSTNPVILAQCQTPGQPTMIPGTPNVSMGMEAFQDSAMVNGTMFPTLTVDPRAYRFRILNAASDRFWNLSFYQADPAQLSPDARLLAGNRSNKTEVKMLPASRDLAEQFNWPATWPIDGRDGGVPDPALLGPSFLQIASEGGFLPKPVQIDPQPITYNADPTAFWVGTVNLMGLALGPAERADVIVDFSQYAGQTLILYNDAPAAWPARVSGYDYFTGAADQRESGGYGTGGIFNLAAGVWENGSGPLVGYAPNTRTVMQVIVRPTVGTDTAYSFNRANLELEFTAQAPVTALNPAPVKTLFERAQEPIIVGQAAYADAYPGSYFPSNFPWEGISQINDNSLNFVTLAGEQVVAPMEPKGIHDEMGASFDPIYGRMSGNLAMQLPNPTTLNALLVLYGFSDLPTETVNNSTELQVSVVPGTTTLADGTQIWKISHNGVDTHPIHFHIFDVQVVNRVGWDGQILLPEPNELGWKDTVKISPLMDTVVAVRPRAPALPFGIANSLRPLNPSIPLDSGMGFNSVDWQTGEARPEPVTNIMYDFGWEYVWHCHILSHEEMDMMRPIVLKVVTATPPAFSAQATPNAGNIVVSWSDPTPVNYAAISSFGNPANEIGFNVYRSSDGINFSKLNAANLQANSTSYTDTTTAGATAFVYKVEAFSANGSTFSSPATPVAASVAVTNGPAFTAPATVNLQASVSSIPVGMTVSAVAFFSGATQIGVDSTPGPISTFNWSNVPAGSYFVTARITDNRGGVTVTAPITVNVAGTLVANFTATGSAAGADIGFCETVTFANSSTGPVTGYSWLINGTNYLTSTVNTTLPQGSYPVTLAVVNSATGETAQVSKTVTIVNHNPTALAGGPYTVSPGGSLILSGSGSDAQDPCNTAALSYAWNVDNKGNFDVFTAGATLSYDSVKTILGVGTHTVTFRVTDSNGGVGTASTSVTVMDTVTPLVINTTSLPNGAVNIAYSGPVVASGDAPLTWSATGLPNGLTINPGTGVISGTPANVVADNVSSATFPVTVTVTDRRAATANVLLNLRINQTAPARPSGLTVTSVSPTQVSLTWSDNANNEWVTNVQRATSPDFTVGLTSINLNGTTVASYNDSTLAPDTNYYYRVRGGNYVAWSAFSNTATVTAVVSPVVTTTSLVNGAVNVAYNGAVSATDGLTPYTWSATGLPSGLTINSGTGVISGTPANVVADNVSFATFPVTVRVTDSRAATASVLLNLRINQTAPARPSGLAVTSVSPTQVSLTWSDNANNEWVTNVQRATSSDFTTGLTSININGTTVASYNDSTLAPGTNYYYRVRGGNYVAWSAFSNTATVIAVVSPAITTTSLVNGAVNVAYNGAVVATDGLTPYTWSATGLPSGLTINSGTGVISGTPANVVADNVSSATFPVTVRVTDSRAATASVLLNLRINQTAPARPSGLAATSASPTQVSLTWSDNANNEWVTNVQRATNPEFTTGFTSINLNGTAVAAYNDSNLASGMTYYYRVRGGNYVAWSAFSSTATVTTP